MKTFRTAALVLGTLLTVPAMGMAAPAQTAPAKKTSAAAPAAVATHTTKGTISSIDATSLVVSRSVSGKPHPITFTLNGDTQRKVVAALLLEQALGLLGGGVGEDDALLRGLLRGLA